MKFNKKELISIIQNTETFTSPIIELEQYSVNASCAVDIIYYAGFEFNDINQAFVYDLGAGTGRLSIASAFFNASYVLSVDIDINALKILKKNVHSLELDNIIFPLCADIEFFEISQRAFLKKVKVTTIMNPPFGVQTKFADRIFLKKAFKFSDIVYSIHLANKKVFDFISTYTNKLGWKIDNVLPFNMILEKTFPFHTQKTKKIDVHIYRFIKK
ncbi:MAG: methyltransferase [Candidatus Lokiarchaeota archaeon]|nr:methyltransferase [Candidatus Lokiarchaeota archaeon]MCK4479736.1 methyltransferase [Candidatus Lokiarchaeota archaeon]